MALESSEWTRNHTGRAMSDIFGPRPYVPPVSVVSDRRTVVQLSEYRLYHECYKCGHYESDLRVLDAHEDQCKVTRLNRP